jgi:hypothetical protein
MANIDFVARSKTVALGNDVEHDGAVFDITASVKTSVQRLAEN